MRFGTLRKLKVHTSMEVLIRLLWSLNLPCENLVIRWVLGGTVVLAIKSFSYDSFWGISGEIEFGLISQGSSCSGLSLAIMLDSYSSLLQKLKLL